MPALLVKSCSFDIFNSLLVLFQLLVYDLYPDPMSSFLLLDDKTISSCLTLSSIYISVCVPMHLFQRCINNRKLDC